MMQKRLLVISLVFWVNLAISQETPEWQIADAAELSAMCGVCHGPTMNGSIRRDGPALAGLSADYIARQLRGYAEESRGYDNRDVLGKFMVRMSGMFRNEETIVAVAEYIANTYTPNSEEHDARPRAWDWQSEYGNFDLSNGDATSGQNLYATCAVCHGVDGEGMEAMFTDTLVHFSEDYLARQMQYFRDGVRGAEPGDIYGNLMAPMAANISDQDIADLVTYITSEL